MKTNDYDLIIVESYKPTNTSGLHGLIHIRPIEGQGPFLQSMHVECSKKLMNNYPVGTRFKIKAKITDRQGGGYYIYSHHSWSFNIL